MIATEYCVNTNPKGAEALPKFLRQVGSGRYRMIDEPRAPLAIERDVAGNEKIDFAGSRHRG
jgi:hypothetical protein